MNADGKLRDQGIQRRRMRTGSGVVYTTMETERDGHLSAVGSEWEGLGRGWLGEGAGGSGVEEGGVSGFEPSRAQIGV